MSALTEPVAGYAALYHVTQRRSAVSIEAQVVRTTAGAVLESEERSLALFGPRSAAISEIWSLVDDSGEHGEGADSGSPRAAEQAAQFIRALPSNIQLPEYATEPDGSISLDWIRSRHRVFSLSVGESPRLPYAWLDGADVGHAVAYFDGEAVPARILEGIRRIMRDGSASVRP